MDIYSSFHAHRVGNTTDRIKPVICSSAEYVTTGSESQNREQIKVEASNSPASDAS